MGPLTPAKTGDTYGKLTVLKIQGEQGGLAVSLCACGKIVETYYSELYMGKVKSCGCGRNKTLKYTKMAAFPANKRFRDITGCVFGRLTAVSFCGLQENSRSGVWMFKCVCGTEIIRIGNQVVSGDINSCGCKRKDLISSRFLKPDGLSIKHSSYMVHLKCAKKRNIPSYLSFEDYLSVASKECSFCGDTSTRHDGKKKRSIKLNSVDRQNNEPYYKLENSIPCCFVCQKMKGALKESDFLKKIASVFKYRRPHDQV